MKFDYKKVTEDFLGVLSERSKIIISRRFAFGKKRVETLEKIGNDYKITRERVRQIESDGIKKINKNLNGFKTKKDFDEIQKFFYTELEKSGGLKREDLFLDILGDESQKNYIVFLLHLSNKCERLKEDNNFHALWTLDKSKIALAKEINQSIVKVLREKKSPLAIRKIAEMIGYKEGIETLETIMQISKKIDRTIDKKSYGLIDWPEVNPKTVKDKIYFILKQNKKPLHYKDISKSIDSLNGELVATSVSNKKLHPQTIHNELIRNNNFVLIGRGIYALKEWGYNGGQVKDVILDILKNTKTPLTKEQVIILVSEKRIVRESTILLNLQNKQMFAKDDTGRYKIRES
ncbi:MAG: sigma factor-like helix-turn-helix DNA-binding protein [Candidatus Pacebacteria bacterium]|nr:sigma factor-like helix-turn-helix DNA-binding protein [Candidatus Paceibacterota bacterium]MDD3919238.1 sigma factor-like helix-turn-helix DNA-binding protein [Candidatus Paceibacterota bacterium]